MSLFSRIWGTAAPGTGLVGDPLVPSALCLTLPSLGSVVAKNHSVNLVPMIPPGIVGDAGDKATETFATCSRNRSLSGSAVWTPTLQRVNIFKQGKMICAPHLTTISLFRRKSVSGLANKTCTGTSKRYQLCKVQVRISFVLLGKSCMAFLGPLERGHHLS